MQAWRELWRGPPASADETSERLQTAHALLRAGTVVVAIGLAASLLLSSPAPLSHLAFIGILLVHILCLFLIRRRLLTATIVTFAALYLVVVLVVMLRLGGVRSPGGYVLPALVLLVGLTLSGRAAVITAIAAAVELVAVLALEKLGHLPAVEPAPTERQALVAIIAVVVTALMLSAALSIIRSSRARAVAEEQARRIMEERLQQSRRLEAVGRLAAGVAHDFNNLLTVMFAEATRLRRGDARTAAAAGNIATAAQRAAALTRQLLTFGRRQVRAPEVLDLNEVVGQLEKLLGSFLGEDIRLEVVLAPESVAVRADRTEIEQILLNLVTNARDAMPEGGVVTIRTARADDGRVLLEVVDTGAGIDPADQAHLFEPFFTTKEVGRGTGLGLATVHDIVTRADGEIRVVSVVGTGTRFTVALPEAREPAAAPVAVAAGAGPAAGATIVVVDDDSQVRAAVEEVIADAGYHVKAVRSPRDLLDESTSWTSPPDLILTDVMMTELPGPELVRHLRARFPGLRALFMSGHAEDRLSERGVLAPGVHFIAKPLEQAALLDAIARVLASDNPGSLGPELR